MTQVLSSLFRVEIVAPPSTLSSVAASLSANQWGSLTVNNQLRLNPPPNDDAMMSYSYRMSWDTVRKGLQYYGGCHGSPGTQQRLFLGLFGATANGWNPTTPLSVPGGVTGNPVHAFWAGTTNTSTGDFYCVDPYINTTTVNRYRPSTGTWDTPFPTRTGRDPAGAVLEYHPNLYGGQGGLVLGNDGGLWTLNVNAGSPAWTYMVDRSNQVDAMTSGGFGVSCYSTKDDCVYMGAGAGGGALWCVTAAGTAARIAAAPVTLGIWDAFNNAAGIYNSGNAANDFVSITRDGAVNSYNKSSNTWSSVVTSVPAALTAAPNDWMAFGTIPEYGCIAAIYAANSAGTINSSTTIYVWKH